MATKQQKEWVDARGQKVPVGYVSKYDKARDKAVRRVLAGREIRRRSNLPKAVQRRLGFKCK